MNTWSKFYEEQLKEFEEDKTSYPEEYRKERIEYYKEEITKQKESDARRREIIEIYKTDCKGTFLEPLYDKINSFEQNPEKLLATEYNAIYTIENPMLNNAKQEINQTFLLNGDRTKVLSTD